MRKKCFFSGIIILIGIISITYGQNADSPYSIIGIGVTKDRGVVYNDNMGGLGISNGKAWTLNTINPALLSLNTFTSFEGGMQIENRTLRNSTSSQENATGGLKYLNFGFPIKSNKWTMAFGVMPYSNVSYNMTSRTDVENKEEAIVYNSFEGSGGINQLYMANGWKLMDQLSVGVRVSFLFGSTVDETFSIPYETDTAGSPLTFLTTDYYRASRYSDFLLEGGIHFNQKLGKKTKLNLGLIYELPSNITTIRSSHIDSYYLSNTIVASDTLLDDIRGKTYIPGKLGGGISFENPMKWTVGMDFYVQDWSKFKTDFSDDFTLQNSYKVIVGGEFTPDITSVNSYLKRVTYQAGFSYKKTPYFINNQDISDFGINFGVSLPVGGASLLNVGGCVGHMGSTSNGLIRENYFKLLLGVTINDRSYGYYRNKRKFN